MEEKEKGDSLVLCMETIQTENELSLFVLTDGQKSLGKRQGDAAFTISWPERSKKPLRKGAFHPS